MWFTLALGTAVMWGLAYAITAYLSKSFSGASVLFTLYAMATPIFGFFCYKTGSFTELPSLAKWPQCGWLILMALAMVAGNLFIFQAFKLSNNPFWVNIIEISFPLFTVIFSALLFKSGHISALSLAGFALIAAGLTCIYRVH